MWADAGGNGNDGTVTRGDLVQSVETSCTERATRYVAGNMRNTMSGKVIHSQFTICSVTRYTGPTRGRVLMGKNGNWLHGHNGGGVRLWRSTTAGRLRKTTMRCSPTLRICACGMNKRGADTIRLLRTVRSHQRAKWGQLMDGWWRGADYPDGPTTTGATNSATGASRRSSPGTGT